MRRDIIFGSIAAVLVALPAGMACAQGASTQDPGRITPGNLTFQNLGPAGPVPGPTESRRPTAQWLGAYGTNGTSGPVVGPGTGSTGFGSGNGAGFGGNATGAGR